MQGLTIELRGETASFRDPGAQLYHLCLPLPPCSTIVGLAGAALGKSFADVWSYFKNNSIYIGVKGGAKGKGKDLWNYTKRTCFKSSNEKNDIVLREFLYKPEINLFYACQDKNIVNELSLAFKNPGYALTLGNSDELARINRIEEYGEEFVEVVKTKQLENTQIPGNISQNFVFNWEKIKDTPIRLTLQAPLVKNLPVDFTFDKEGSRKGAKYEEFSFIDDLMELKEEIEVFQFRNILVPMYRID